MATDVPSIAREPKGVGERRGSVPSITNQTSSRRW